MHPAWHTPLQPPADPVSRQGYELLDVPDVAGGVGGRGDLAGEAVLISHPNSAYQTIILKNAQDRLLSLERQLGNSELLPPHGIFSLMCSLHPVSGELQSMSNAVRHVSADPGLWAQALAPR